MLSELTSGTPGLLRNIAVTAVEGKAAGLEAVNFLLIFGAAELWSAGVESGEQRGQV